MPTETSYIRIVETGPSKSGKTKMFAVMNAGGDTWLGSISWYGPWRRYVFMTTVKDIVFDHNCLRQIAEFTETETKKHKDALHQD